MGRRRDEREQAILLRIRQDEKSLKEAQKNLQALEAEIKALDRAVSEASDPGESFRAFERMEALKETVPEARAAVDRLTASLADQRRALEQARASADDYGAAMRQARERVESFGDVSTSVMQVSGFLRGVGAGGVADVAMLGADVGDLVEGLGRLPTALRGAGQSAQAAIQGLTGAEVSLSALAVAGGAVGAVGAVVAGAFAIISSEQQRVAENTTRWAERLRELNRIIAGGATATDLRIQAAQGQQTAEGARQSMEDIAEALRQALLDVSVMGIPLLTEEQREMVRQASADELVRFASQFPDALFGQIASLETRWTQAYQEYADALVQQSETVQALLDDETALNDRLAETQRNLELRIRAEELMATSTAENVQAMVEANNRQIAALEEARAEYAGLAGTSGVARERLAGIDRQLEELRATNEALLPVLERLTALEQARARETEAVQAQLEAQLEALETRREQARLEQEIAGILQRSADRQRALKEATEERIAGLESAFDSFVENAEGQIARARDEAGARIREVEQGYMAESLAAWQDFYKEERRAFEDYRTQRLRRQEDLFAELQSAADRNDVVAFIQAERRGLRDLRRLDEDQDREARRRREDFEAEARERREEAAARIKEIRAEREARLAEIRAGIDRERDLLRQRIQQERDALVERLQDARSALQAEIAQRKQAHVAALQEQAAYEQARLDLQRRGNEALLAIEARYQALRSGASGGAVSGLKVPGTSIATALFTNPGVFVPRQSSPAVTQRSVTVVNDLRGVQIASGVSKEQLDRSLLALMETTVKAFR